MQFQLELRLQLRLLVKLLHDQPVLLHQMGRVLLAPGELLLQRKVHVMGLLQLSQKAEARSSDCRAVSLGRCPGGGSSYSKNIISHLLVGLVEELQQHVHGLVEPAADVLRRLLALRCDLRVRDQQTLAEHVSQLRVVR